jgi:hypothetical protein
MASGKFAQQQQHTQPQQKPPESPKPTIPPSESALATVNNFELAGKVKAIDRKTELVEIARTAYRKEMATLPDDIAAMLADEDLALDVTGFFGVGQLNLDVAPIDAPEPPAGEQTVETFALSS